MSNIYVYVLYMHTFTLWLRFDKIYKHRKWVFGIEVTFNSAENACILLIDIYRPSNMWLEKEVATYSSILVWKTHGLRRLEGYSPWGHKRVGCSLVTKWQQQINDGDSILCVNFDDIHFLSSKRSLLVL